MPPSPFENKGRSPVKKLKVTENNFVPVHDDDDDNQDDKDEDDENTASNEVTTSAPVKWKSKFTLRENLTFEWKPLKTSTDKFINPTKENYTCADLLLIDAFL